jgi:hypothetical protein
MEPQPDDADNDPVDDGGDGGPSLPPAGGGGGSGPPAVNYTASIEAFTATVDGLNVTFVMNVTTNDPEATWLLLPGDGAEYTGAVDGMVGSMAHAFLQNGTYNATLSVSYGSGESVESVLEVMVTMKVPLPDVLVFEYGPSLGCLGAPALCVSQQFQAEMDGVDGHWQALDERYWGLAFNATNAGEYEDTDCTAFDADGKKLADFHNDGGACGGDALPEGTAWLFMYSWIAPSTAMRLEFTLPQ